LNDGEECSRNIVVVLNNALVLDQAKPSIRTYSDMDVCIARRLDMQEEHDKMHRK
jgi:hypothetical protein